MGIFEFFEPLRSVEWKNSFLALISSFFLLLSNCWGVHVFVFVGVCLYIQVSKLLSSSSSSSSTMAVENAEPPQRQSIFKSLGNGILMTLAAGPALAAYHYRGYGNADPMWCSKGMYQFLDLTSLSGNEFLYQSPTLSLTGICFVLVATLHLLNLLQGSSWLVAPYWAIVPSLSFVYYLVHPCAFYDVARAGLVGALIGAWSLKTFYSYLRKEGGELGAREDWRFAELRESTKGGATWARSSFFSYYLPYLGALVLLTLPLRSILFATEEFGTTVQDWIGAGMCLAGLAVNIVADYQLAAYMAPEEKPYVLHTGLWRYCRHPNHLGDQVFWWGLATMAMGLGGAWTAWGAIANAFIGFAVTEMVEKRMLASRERRRPYILYRLGTPRLVPWMPTEVNITKGELRVMASTYSPHAKRRTSNMPLSPASLDSTQATFSACNVSVRAEEEEHSSAVQRRLDFEKTFDSDMEKMKAAEADVSDEEALSFAVSLESVADSYRRLVKENEEFLANVEQKIADTMPPAEEDRSIPEESIPEEPVVAEATTPVEEEIATTPAAEEAVAPEEEEVAEEEVSATPEEAVVAEEEATVAEEAVVAPEEEVATPEESAPVPEEEEEKEEEKEEEEEEEETEKENDKPTENIFPSKEDVFPEAANKESVGPVFGSTGAIFINPCLMKGSQEEEVSEEAPEAEKLPENPFTPTEEEEEVEEATGPVVSKEEKAKWLKYSIEDIQNLKVVELRQILKKLGEGTVYHLRKPALVRLLSSLLEAERAQAGEAEEKDVAVGEEKEEEKEEEEEEIIRTKRSRTPGRRSWTPNRRRKTQEDGEEEEKEIVKKRAPTPKRKRSSSRGAIISMETKKSKVEEDKEGENAPTNTAVIIKKKKEMEPKKIEDMKCKELQVELKKRGESPWGLKKKDMVSLLKKVEKSKARSKLFDDEQPAAVI